MSSSQSPFTEDERCRFRPIQSGGLRVVLRVTMRCDLACPHCLASARQGGDELETGEWLALFRQFPEIGATKVLLTGGEPLMRPDIVRFVEALSQAGIASDLNSNLQRMTPSLMHELQKAGLSEISVSLEGPAQVHDRMHGKPGAHAQLVDAIGWADQAGIGVDASCCLTQENCAYVEDLVDKVTSLPIRSLTFSRLLPIGHGFASRQAVSQPDLDGYYTLIRQIAAHSPIPIRATGLLGAPRPADCGRGRSLLAIAPDGQLLGCALSDDNPRVPHPLEAGLKAAWDRLREALESGSYALCWQEE